MPVFLTIPNFFAMSIVADTEKTNTTIYTIRMTEDDFLFKMTFILYSVILKLVPCIVLTIITGCLIRALYKAEERSARLKNGSNLAARRPSALPVPQRERAHDNENGGGGVHRNNSTMHRNGGGGGHKGMASVKSSRKRSTDRTTRLLIAILGLFLLTEFPQV